MARAAVERLVRRTWPWAIRCERVSLIRALTALWGAPSRVVDGLNQLRRYADCGQVNAFGHLLLATPAGRYVYDREGL